VGRRAIAGIAAVLALVAFVPVLARASTPAGDNALTLSVSVPGPLNSCSVLDPGATATTGAVLDLARPSAFLTSTNGALTGAGGPIATAELTSLSPETVVYTIAAHQLWSNGLSFNGADLVAWWQRARSLPSVQSDGYRDIQSMSVGSNGLTVTAIFATAYADWNLLFRDVEARGTTPGCAIDNLVKRPSLGPYRVVSATVRQIVMAMNRRWGSDTSRFGRVVVTTSGAIPSKSSLPFANYSLDVSHSQIQALSSHPAVASRIGTSSNVEVMTFAPNRPLTRAIAMRKALSWSIDRQGLINRLWGSITFSPAVAASALFSQGQNAYPGGAGTTPTTPTTASSTTVLTSNGLADCRACAFAELLNLGLHRAGRRWENGAGHPIELRVVSGPSVLDRATASALVAQWAAAGIGATIEHDVSDAAAAEVTATNLADVAVYSKPTTSAPSVAARSWSGPGFPDSYLSGFRSPNVTSLFTNAIANFNSAAATSTWLQLDQAVLHAYWIRPLFTAPSLVEWSNTMVGVTGSISVPGFLDQLTSWNTSTAAG